MPYYLKEFTITATNTTRTLPTQNPDQYVGVGRVETAHLFPIASGGLYRSLTAFERSKLRGVDIPLRGAISTYAQTAAQLETELRNLRQLVGVEGKLTRHWDSSSNEEWCNAECIAFDAQRNAELNNWLDVSMLFRMTSPSWYDDTETNYNSGNLTAGSGNTNTETVTNSGNYYVTNAVITLTAGSANITDAIIQKTSAAGTIYNELHFSGTILAGNALVIDTGALTVLNNGSDAIADFSLGSSHKEPAWFTLWAGDNTVKVTLTGGGVDSVLDVDFYPAHA